MNWFRRILAGYLLGAVLALTLLALGEVSAQAGDLVVSHSVSISGPSTFVGFGPAGPNCNGTTDFSACTFFTTAGSGTGKSEPGGPFTFTTTTTTYFGLDDFAFTVNGAANSDGSPAGFCLPFFSTAAAMYSNGTISTNSTGQVCCAGTSCGSGGTGPPSTAQSTSVCTSGTGKYAGIQCSEQGSAMSLDGVTTIGRTDSVSTR
jgi:hypothetical protein